MTAAMQRRFLSPTWLSPLVAAIALALGGCASMAPDYVRPASPVAAHFGNAAVAADQADASTATPPLAWRSVYLDARLQQVIAMALDNNRDLRVALLNIEKARAQYRIQQADLLPTVQASASQTTARTGTSASGSGQSQVSRSASAQLGFSSWELDLFGRIRSLSDAALASYLATAQTQRSTRMSLVAEVATDWLTVAAYQERLALAQQTLQSQRETLRLTERKHQHGAASGIDVRQVQASVETARADVASYTAALAQARNALDLVVGAAVADPLLPAAQGASNTDALTLSPIAAELPSSVLLQRPDVLYAEQTLQAANANIGAARAALFPSISLTASAGSSSDALSGLFGAGSRTWSFMPSITVPLFNAGALQASLDVAQIQKDVTVAQYELAIQTAFKETADALVARDHIGEQLDAQAALVNATQQSYQLAEARYRKGVSSYLEALDSQRSLYSAQQNLISLRLQEAVNRVTLYKVLGGGADATPRAAVVAEVATGS